MQLYCICILGRQYGEELILNVAELNYFWLRLIICLIGESPHYFNSVCIRLN